MGMATKKDFTQVAHAVFMQATGAAPKPAAKSESAVRAGRAGGAARGASLTPEDRRRIASEAAKARWKK